MRLLVALLDLYTWVIIIRALLSWVSPDPRNPLVQLLVRLTEPVLGPLRSLVPPRLLRGIDVSPLIAILLVQVIRRFLITTFYPF